MPISSQMGTPACSSWAWPLGGSRGSAQCAVNSAPVTQVNLIQGAWLCEQQGRGVTKPQGSAVQVTLVFPRLEGKVAPSSPGNVPDFPVAARHWSYKTEAEGLDLACALLRAGTSAKKTPLMCWHMLKRQTCVAQ